MDQTRRTPERTLEIALHPGQKRAIESGKRFVVVLAGWQSGKTVIGPPWAFKEIKARGPGDYLIASPTYPLMMKKVLPEFLALFKRAFRLGEFVGQPRNCFTFSDKGARRMFGRVPDVPTQIFFGHAGDPDSLESATYKAAWLDEAGQNGFRLESYEAIVGRLSIHEGRVLITTRPYNLGWLKQLLYDPWVASGRNHRHIDVVHFRSIDNPAFPRAEYERAKASMPPWRFRMKYDAAFERPAGMIYDCFDDAKNRSKPFPIPPLWQRYCGLDFGGQNTAGVFLAECPKSGTLYACREYGPAGGLTAAGHAAALKKGEAGVPQSAGGARSEQQWRDEFRAAGWPVAEPGVSDVEVGINRVYGALATGKLVVFEGLARLLDELATYSRELDDAGNVTEKIANKNDFHMLDALRYIVSHVLSGAGPWDAAAPEAARSMMADAPDADSGRPW